MGTPTDSPSYVYGFNNLAANLSLASLLALLFALSWLRRLSRGASETQATLLSLLLPEQDSLCNSKGLFLAMGITTAIAVVIQSLIFRMLPYDRYGEFGNFVSELDQMPLGLKPYRDFQFNYGPLILYPCFWLYKAMGGLLSIDTSCFALVLCHWVAGYFLLVYIVRAFGGRFSRPTLFLLVGLVIINITLGLQYTPVRFLVCFASLIFLNRCFTAYAPKPNRRFIIVVLAFILPLANLAISPEFGVASVAGITAYFVALSFTPQRRWGLLAIAPALSFVGAAVLLSKDYFEGMFTFAGGGNNYPVFPTLHMLLLLAAACWVLPQLAVIGVSEHNQKGAFASALLISMGLTIPASLGRCDGGHIFFNSLGIFILFVALVLQMKDRSLSKTIIGIYAAIYLVIWHVGAISAYSNDVKAALSVRDQLSHLPGGFDPLLNQQTWQFATNSSNKLSYSKLLPFDQALTPLLRYPKIGTPLSCSEEIEHFLKLSGRYLPEYYFAYTQGSITSQKHMDRKLADLARMPVILIPKMSFLVHAQAHAWDYFVGDMQLLQQQLLFPISLTPRNKRFSAEDGILADIAANYTVTEAFRDNVILTRSRAISVDPSMK